MTLPLAPSFKGFGAKLQPKRSHPSPQFQSVVEWEDTFLALFSHRHDYIWAAHPQSTAKPAWQTESRHPLSDRLILQGGYLYGVRFGPKTNYLLFDIDSGSFYHPRRDPFAIARLVAALEVLGLVSYIAVTSSYSGGLHLYFPFEQAQKSYELAGAVQALLENAGFVLSPGQLELFPNDRGFVDGKPTLYAAHRLPLQLGSYLLDSDWQPILSTQHTFVQQWQLCQYRNPVTSKAVRQILKTAKRQRFSLSGKVDKFLNDLNAEIEPGWSGTGQTNRILGRIALRTYIFAKILYGVGLEGQALVKKMVEVATALPGYREFCQHQHEIQKRTEEWAQSVETSSRYFPYQQRKAKPKRSAQPAETPSWHEQQGEEARGRIKRAIAQMLDSGTLPSKPTARYKALLQHGIGGETLYKHKDLWHSEFLLPIDPELLESPSAPPNRSSERVVDAPERASLLDSNTSDTPLGKTFRGFEPRPCILVSSDTYRDRKLAQARERQITKMRQYFDSDDPILIREAREWATQNPGLL